MTIRLGYEPLVLSHNFEYGKDNGLISIERANTNPDVYTRLAVKVLQETFRLSLLPWGRHRAIRLMKIITTTQT